MKNKVCFFSIASKDHMKYFEMMKNSLSKFHPNIPLLLWDDNKIDKYKDKEFFYRATPIIAKELIDQYDCVVKLDADQIITGDLSHIWEGDYDVAVVNNSNPREQKIYPVSVWNINPLAYVNCGLVAMKSKRFIEHWFNQCFSNHFSTYQFREQDLLNILLQYGDYKVKRLDEGNKSHGLISKGYWPELYLKDGKLIFPQTDGWPTQGNTQIVVLHWAGGNSVDKMNFRIRFKPEVVKFLEGLVK